MKFTQQQAESALVVIEAVTAFIVGLNLGFIVSVIWSVAQR